MKAHQTRYWIITLEVTEVAQMIEFSFKIPNHLTALNALIVNANRKEGDLGNIPQIGELTCQLNNRKTTAIHLMVEHSCHPTDCQEYELDEEIFPDQSLTGYYFDGARTIDSLGKFRPYTVKMYFKCK